MTTSIYPYKSIPKSVIFVAFPAILGQLSSFIYNIAATFFVSLTGNPDAIAAVTLCTPPTVVIMALALIFANGGSSYISRKIGENNLSEARICAAFCFYGSILFSLVLMVLGIIFINPLVHIIGADANTFSYCKNYLIIIVCGAPFAFFYTSYAALFRAAGWTKESSFGIILGNIVNVAMNFVLIMLLDMGVTGAAIATVVGNLVNTLYYLYILSKRRASVLSCSVKDFHPSFKLGMSIFSVGIPGSLVIVLLCVSTVVLNNFLKIYGSETIAAYGVASRIYFFITQFNNGLTQGVTPLLGYAYGAKETQRLKKTISFTLLVSIICGALFLIVFYFGRNFLASLFLSDPALVGLSGTFLTIFCLSAPFTGFCDISLAFYQSIAKPTPCMVITLLRQVIIYLPALVLLNQVLNAVGCVGARPAADILTAIIAFILMVRGLKKLDTRH